jgi:hypothetical protein
VLTVKKIPQQRIFSPGETLPSSKEPKKTTNDRLLGILRYSFAVHTYTGIP